MSRIEPTCPGADNHRQQSQKAWLLVSQPLEGIVLLVMARLWSWFCPLS
jgi:hypothetical protein